MIASPSESPSEEMGEVQTAAGWAELVRLYDEWLQWRVSHAFRQAGLRPVAEQVAETVQEVYCRLIEGGPPRLRLLQRLGGGRMLRYLGRVAESAVVDQMRTAKAVKRRGFRMARMSRRTRVHPALLADPAPGPERVLLLSETRRDLQRRFRTLPGLGNSPKRNALILWLALVEGWRSREIARLFGLSARTVDTLIHRLRRGLAEQGLQLRRRHGV